MIPINEAFTPETQADLAGVYIDYNNQLRPIFPAKTLSADNFRIYNRCVEDVAYTADDFEWTDLHHRSFKLKDSPYYYSRYSTPTEVRAFLDVFICIKFATEKLEKAKDALDCTETEEGKEALNQAIADFKEANNSLDKLHIASAALDNALGIIIDKKTHQEIYNAIGVINKICDEINLGL